jgi:hypothetical protein
MDISPSRLSPDFSPEVNNGKAARNVVITITVLMFTSAVSLVVAIHLRAIVGFL